ncbi:MAG: hypothetical protein IKG56_04330 [Clostridia bacterium]|nr:hypothetical protein [Clostridia bacterium]
MDNKKMEEFNEKMKDLNAKIKDSAETVAIIGLEAKDKLDEKIKDSRSSIEALKENYRLLSERSKSKISSELIKAQMNIQVAKEKMQEYKEIKDKEKLEKYIDDEIEYADNCIALSLLAAEEAKLAFLEAVESQKEYDEKYGKE